MENVRPLRLVPPARRRAPEQLRRPEPLRQPEPLRHQEPPWREAVGQRLRRERHRRSERISDVASRAGVSPQYLSELERGRKDASSEMLAALAGALELPLRVLLEGATTGLATERTPAPGRAGGSDPVCLAA
jgi:ribosome-binding protein aMBF1 (putative translation factor)